MTSERLILRVVKVGGSLLDWPQLPAALDAWLSIEPGALNILLCGCGPFGDLIRNADRDFSLGEEASHWFCIELLATTARLLSAILPAAERIEEFEQLSQRIAARQSANLIFDPREFLRHYEPTLPGCVLPHSWSVTTDSIAARLAEVLNADELILLKSTDVPHSSLTNLVSAGHIDAHFPTAATSLKAVRIINLKGPLDMIQMAPDQ